MILEAVISASKLMVIVMNRSFSVADWPKVLFRQYDSKVIAHCAQPCYDGVFNMLIYGKYHMAILERSRFEAQTLSIIVC